MRSRPIPASLLWLAALVFASIATAFETGVVIYMETRTATRTQANASAHGDWRAGRAAIGRYGCGACHVIPGIHGATGQVGPDLSKVGERATIAGTLTNDPAVMAAWIQHPQKLKPGVGMPERGVSEQEARDMAAYLYSED